MEKISLIKTTSLLTCALVFALIVVKIFAYSVSGSVAVLASLLDSIVDAGVSVLHFFAISYSARPADDDHRHGHGKIEGLSALLQGIVMAAVAVFVVQDAYGVYVSGQVVQSSWFVIALFGVSMLCSLVIVLLQIRAMKQSTSLVIEADHAHYKSDFIHHVGVIVSLIAVMYDVGVWVDLLCGVIIALWVLWSARGIACKGIDMILDRELPDVERESILVLIRKHDLVLGVHDLRATRSGMMEKIFFDIEADPEISCRKAHDITRDLERDILTLYPNAEVMIHVDPFGEIEDSRHKNKELIIE